MKQTKERFGKDLKNFLENNNPSMQLVLCVDEKECFDGDYPTLSLLQTTYGNNSASMWLIAQLYDLSEFCGVKEKLEGKSLEECAAIIANNFWYLKISELMLFFYRFKSARYGKFYGAIDPLAIQLALKEFRNERGYYYETKERAERERKEEESARRAISYEEYLRRKAAARKSEDETNADDKAEPEPKK